MCILRKIELSLLPLLKKDLFIYLIPRYIISFTETVLEKNAEHALDYTLCPTYH